jgi:thiol reductant ABC exporter CydD subunit
VSRTAGGSPAARPFDPRLTRYARSTRAYLAASVLLGVATAAAVLTQAFILAWAITAVFQDGADVADLTPALVGLLAVTAARALIAGAQDVVAARSAAGVKAELRQGLLAHAVALGPAWQSRRRTGDLAVLATRGLDALDAYFARYLPQLVLAAIIPATVVVVLALNDPLTALVVAVTVPLIPVFMVLVGWSTQRQTQRQWASLEALGGHFLDVVAGLPTLKAFGRAKGQARGVAEVGDAYRRKTMRVLRISFLSSLVLELLATISVALVAVEVGVRLVGGTLDLQTGLLVILLAPEAYLPLRQVGLHFHASQEGMAAAARAFEVLDEPLPARAGAAGAPAPPVPDPARAVIRLRGVSVRRPGREVPALAGLDLEIRPGEVLAIAGPSGAGKSTLLAVLLGFLTPDEGTVSVGEADLDGLDLDAWRSHLAWVPQAPRLLAGTVAENVRLGRPDATDAQVSAALEDAGVLAELGPAGAQTVLGEAGSGLSAGQRQRVALARALVRDAGLLLLDEPTAGLDGETEAGVLAALRRHAQGRTVVVVAHRPALVAFADRVVRLEAPEGALVPEAAR